MLQKGDICPNNCADYVFGFHKRVLDGVPRIGLLKTGKKRSFWNKQLLSKVTCCWSSLGSLCLLSVFRDKLGKEGDDRVRYEHQIIQWSKKELQQGFLILHDVTVQVSVSNCKVREWVTQPKQWCAHSEIACQHFRCCMLLKINTGSNFSFPQQNRITCFLFKLLCCRCSVYTNCSGIKNLAPEKADIASLGLDGKETWRLLWARYGIMARCMSVTGSICHGFHCHQDNSFRQNWCIFIQD